MKVRKFGQHANGVFLALLVTFLWSTSWVLIKFGLRSDLPSLTFAGLRYTLAFLIMLPFAIHAVRKTDGLNAALKNSFHKLILLGFVFYSLTQGAQFVSLEFLPAATLTLILNFSPVLVALFSLFRGREKASVIQWAGIILGAIGALIYFHPFDAVNANLAGLTAASVALFFNAASSVLGRNINKESTLPSVVITTASMGVGGILLLIAGITFQGFGAPGQDEWLIIFWLAAVNTAVAFTLWNKSLKILSAVESSVINNTMLPQIVVLAWIFLGEALTARQIAGLLLVVTGIMIVQLKRSPSAASR